MKIRIQHHDGRVECIELSASQTLRFGTRSSADVVLGGPDVHSLHLGILLRNEVFIAVAFKRVGKICVNGHLMRKRVLQLGDRIEAGENLIEVLSPQSEDPQKPRSSDQQKEARQLRSSKSRRGKEASGRSSPSEILDALSDLADESDLLSEPADDVLSIVDQDLASDSFLAGPPTRGAGPRQVNRSVEATPGPRWWTSTWFKTFLISIVVLPLIVLIGIYVAQLPDARERFQLADQFYQRGDYANAIKAYDTYLKYHGQEARADEATVKRQLATLIESLDRGERADSILGRTREFVIQWGASCRCAYAQQGLAQLLPPVIADLTRRSRVDAQRGDDASARESLQQALEALKLAYRYLPPPLQDSSGVDQLQLHFTRLEHELGQPEALRAALSRIEENVDGGGIEEAYAVRGELLAPYPELGTDGRLLAAMRAVGRAAAARVSPASDVPDSNEAAPPQRTWQQVLVQEPVADAAEGHPSAVAVAVAQRGAVYGVDTSTREVLWRHAVGCGATFDPIRVDQSGIVLFDGLRSEMFCVGPTSGAILWRVSLDSLAGPAAVDQRNLIVASNDGVVLGIDVPQGKPVGGLRLPQRICVGPTIDPDDPRYYQLAEHSMVYVLALDQSKCLSAYYLGHEQGSVSLAPVVVGNYLLVWEQVGPEHSVIHVLRRGDQLLPIQTVALQAMAVAAPVVIGDVVYFPGSDGLVHVLRHNAADESRPLHVESAFDPKCAAPHGDVPLRLMAVDGRLWVSGLGLSLFRPAGIGAEPTLQRRMWTDLIVSRLVRTPEGVVAVGKQSSGEMYFVCGGAEGKADTSFQFALAPAPLAPPLETASGEGVWVLRSDGLLCHHTVSEQAVTDDTTTAARIFEVAAAVDLPATCPISALRCGPVGLFAPLRAADCLGIVERDGVSSKPRLLTLSQPLACPPVAMGKWLVLAAQHGPITLYDTQQQRLADGAFLPDMIGGSLPNWRSPAVLPEQQFVMSDGRERLFLLQVSADGDAMVPVASSDESVVFSSPLIAAGTTVWGVSAGDELCRVVTPQLVVERDRQLNASVQWGPTRLGTHGFLATAQGACYCLGNQPGGDWNIQLGIGPVVGGCLVDGAHVALASADGKIAVIDVDAGKLAAAPIDVQQRIAFGPVLLGRRLAVLTPDSCLLIMREAVETILQKSATAGSSRQGDEELVE